MVRSTDQEQLPLKGSSLLMVLKRKDMLPYAGPHEEAPGSVKGQRDRGGNVGKSISMVSRRELVRQGKRAQDGQVEWLERLWGAGAISSGLPPRPGW